MEEGKGSLIHSHFMQSSSPFSRPVSSPLRSPFHRFYKQQPMISRRGRREIGLRNKGDNIKVNW